MALHIGPRLRKVIRYASIVVIALITFVFALQMTFPFDRVKDKLVEEASKDYDVTIGDVERGFLPGRVYFKAVSLRTRPAKPSDPVTTFYLERVKVDLGLFALLSGKASIDLDAKIGAGRLRGHVTLAKSGASLSFEGTDLPGASLPMRAVLGLPMTGKMEFSVDLDLPNDQPKSSSCKKDADCPKDWKCEAPDPKNQDTRVCRGTPRPDWSRAEGKIELGCPSGCTFGDGKTKLRPILQNANQGQQAMVQDGIDFGKVVMDLLSMKVEITPGAGEGKPGKLEVKQFETKSNDGELHVDYAMALEHDFTESVVDGCLRFKPSDTLQRRDQKTYDAMMLTGAERRADGLFHIKLTDRFKWMKRLNLECGPNVKPPNQNDIRPVVRPNLTVMPDEPRPTPAIPPPPPPTPPQPPPGQPEPTRGPPPVGAFRPTPGADGEFRPPAGSGSAVGEGLAGSAQGSQGSSAPPNPSIPPPSF
jgi:type II secretion system protein N